MSDVSEVYDLPKIPKLNCQVVGRLALPNATVEIHQYRFHGPQQGIFRSRRAFLDLALSPRPGMPRGFYSSTQDAGARPLGDIIFVPAGYDLETEWGAGEQRSICCGFDRFDDSLCDAPLGPALDAGGLEACLNVRSSHVRDALLRLAREIEAPGFCSDLLVQAIWMELSIELSRYVRRCRDGQDRPVIGLTAGQIRQIEELMEQPGKMPHIADIARLCDLSPRHFFRMFRAATGETPASYAARKRIERAKQLLATPRPAVKEIAWRCGFETSAAFSAAFHKAVGVTPRNFRQSMLH